MPEADGLLPLAVLRRFADGSVSQSEVIRWRPVIVQITAAANFAEDWGAMPGGKSHLEFPHDRVQDAKNSGPTRKAG